MIDMLHIYMIGRCLGAYSLAILDYEADKGDHVRHYQIHTTSQSQFYITPQTTFDTMADLIAHYQGRTF